MSDLTEKGRKARNSYMRNYRKTHAEKIKKINEKYWNKRAILGGKKEG